MEHVETETAPPERETTRGKDNTRNQGSVQKIRIEQHSVSGMLWLAGWLFTIGFLHLPFWKGVLALIVWPYYLGTSFTLPT